MDQVEQTVPGGRTAGRRPATGTGAEQAGRAPLRRHQQLAGLDTFIKACYPIIHVSTWEERRLIQGLYDRYGLGKSIFQWTYTRGLINLHDQRCFDQKTIGDPLTALHAVERMNVSGLFIFCDLHPWLGDLATAERIATVRLLRDIYHDVRRNRDTDKSILLVSPVLTIPPELEKELVVFDFPLPDRAELGSLLDEQVRRATSFGKVQVRITREDKENLLEAALGLTLDEADNAFSAALLSDGVLEPADIHVILAEKQLIIRKAGNLDYITTPERLDDVGGLENLKEWLRKRSRAFTSEARAFGLPMPKGVLLTGIQGCGKSLSAKAIARNWQLPLLRLDVGKLFGGLVGASEENMRKAIKLAEAIAPCVLWVDELEKGFSGLQSSGSVDGGTTARVFGTFLTWMQEKEAPVFVVATANQIAGLPPELLRKGRFDEIFFIDLPSNQERRRIFEIHLTKRQRKPALFDLSSLVRLSQGFSGAEMEQAIISGMFEAFDAGSDLTTAHVATALQHTIPLSVTMAEAVEELREWAHLRAIKASLADGEESASAPKAPDAASIEPSRPDASRVDPPSMPPRMGPQRPT